MKLLKRAILREGNIARIAKVMRKAKSGQEITIGFIGGSITMGSVATAPDKCYAYRVFEWWQNKFTKTSFHYVNAGIGATTSHFAVARVHNDLLRYNPDLVIEEFSVNDDNTSFFQETFEGLTRVILKYNNEPALIMFNNVCYDTGANAADIHNQIGEAYDLPILSMKTSLYEAVQSGELLLKDITPDDLHPNDYGHELVASIIIGYLEMVYNKVFGNEAINEEFKIRSQAVTKNRFVDAIRYNARNYHPVESGFVTDERVQQGVSDCFKNGWVASKLGASIEFTVTGSLIAIQFRKTIKRGAPIARLIIDGDEDKALLLDANFEETWGDALILQNVLEDESVKEHTLKLQLVQVDEASNVEFYLASIIVANRD